MNMKKTVYAILAVLILLLSTALPASAWDHGGYRGGWHSHGGVGVYIGPGGWWGPGPYWWGPWGSPYYPYYDYAQPPVVVQPNPPVYIQQAPQSPPENYWYYCQESKAYYPYVNTCPSGWLKVVPQTAPPAQAAPPTRTAPPAQ